MSRDPDALGGLVALLSMLQYEQRPDAATYRTEDELFESIKGKKLDALAIDLGPELSERLLAANRGLGMDEIDTFYWFYLRPDIPGLDGRTMHEAYRDGDTEKFLTALRLLELVNNSY